MMDDIRVSCEPIFADSPADVPANTTVSGRDGIKIRLKNYTGVILIIQSS
jgi:hypothetical protein